MPTEPDPAVEPAPARPPKGAVRWGRLAAVGAAVLAAGLWFAPAFVARSGLRHTVAHRIFPGLNADVTVGRAELSWLAPATLRDVTMTARGDAGRAGEPLLRVEAIRTERPLHALLSAALFPGAKPVDYGTITLEEPDLRVRVRPGGSDLEDALAPLLDGESSQTPPGFAVTVKDGSMTVLDLSGRRLEGRVLSGTVRRPAGVALPDRAELAGTWGDGERSGTVAAKMNAAAANGPVTNDPAAKVQGSNRWALRVDGLPLTAAVPLQTRFAAEDAVAWALDGALSADLSGDLDAQGWTAEGRLLGDRVTARRADWSVGDRLRLASAHLAGGLSGRFDDAGAGVRATRLRFVSDLGELSADGPLPTALPADPATLLDGDRRLSGRIDVAALAAQLPGVLGLTEGATVESGSLNLSLTTAAGDAPGARRFAASGELENLRAALPGGERIAPEGPISAQLEAVREGVGAVTIERLAARADGLSAVGRGAVEDLTAEVAVDLAAFDRTFGRLLDLGGRWAGAADGTLRIRRTAANRFAVRAGAVGREIRFLPPAGGSVREEEVTVKVGVDLVRDDAGRWATTFAGAKAESGSDVLSITPRDSGELSLTLDGELATLRNRVATLVDFPVDSAAGGLRASATLLPAGAGWAVEEGKAELRRLIVDVPGLRLRESVATLEARGTLDPAAGTFAGAFQWVGDALSLQAERVRFDSAATPALTADLTARGDAARFWAWFPAADAASVRPEGRFTADGAGTAEFGPAGFAGAGFTGTVAFTDLSILTPPDPRSAPVAAWSVAWREPTATLAGSVRYDAGAADAGDALHLGPLAVTAGGASLTAGGVVQDLSGAMRADLSGRLAVDWATLGPRLGTAEAGATLTGRSDRPFTLRGPLGSLSELSGRAGLGWDELRGGGFSFGPGVLVATLDGGRARIDGVDWPLVPLSGGDAAGGASRSSIGRLQTTPTVDFTGREAAVRLPAGRILSGVRFTPEATRGWLGLVSPLAAGSVQADGAFDVDLDGAAAPLSDLLAGDLRRAGAGGRLVVERADFTAGPVADGLLGAVRGASALLRGSVGGDLQDVRVRLPAQSTPFRLSGGRVFHQNLIARSGSVEVTTSGSVGLDGALDLRAEIPLGGDLGGRRATVPIGGTIDAPRIDAARLAEAAARGAVDTAVERERGRLEEKATREIGRGLDRLFGRE
ncbi:hypothetical protein [Alienimonas californiensis]|uniref:AsmA-like C-terminal domain-containing protein n=1 Tax=Alienimonas californiensis TaxID=2527989 RepID=A0A517P8W3_9PLAN|nr:hypothetical protein [Alienimonas californiensis]QDT15816.1 hypothetical protein CA12_19110 [Alienimonas californiensis]